MQSISGILLAAGTSERFGSDKLLAMLSKDERLLERALRIHLQSRIRPLVVVLSAHLKQMLVDQPDIVSVAKLAIGETLYGQHTFSCQWGTGRLAANDNPQLGMSSSIHVGLNSLTNDEKSNGVAISLADLPLLTPETIDSLIDEFLAKPIGIVLPVYNGRTGHPVIIDIHRFQTDIHKIEGDVGLRGIIEQHPEEVQKVPWHDDSVIQDIDSSADLERLFPYDKTHH
ncbi:MAG: nucleotidyltransferase family protein [Thermodesulfobacteriota bacterium]